MFKWVLLGVAALLVIMFIGANNGQIQSANNVRDKWATVQTRYQRRLDLANQLVGAIKGATAEELAVFNTLANQAAGLSGSLSKTPPTEGQAATFDKNATGFNQAFINAVSYVADNPDIVTGELFSNLMIEVEGSENRVAIARDDYDQAVTSYRNTIEQFPGSIIAGMNGRTVNDFAYFEGTSDSQSAPTINFGNPPTAVPR